MFGEIAMRNRKYGVKPYLMIEGNGVMGTIGRFFGDKRFPISGYLTMTI